MKKLVIAASLLTATFALAGSYDKCITCHGATGEKPALGKSKIIKDMTKDEIVAALNGYKAGTYGGATKGLMTSQVKDLSENDIKDIAKLIGK